MKKSPEQRIVESVREVRAEGVEDKWWNSVKLDDEYFSVSSGEEAEEFENAEFEILIKDDIEGPYYSYGAEYLRQHGEDSDLDYTFADVSKLKVFEDEALKALQSGDMDEMQSVLALTEGSNLFGGETYNGWTMDPEELGLSNDVTEYDVVKSTTAYILAKTKLALFIYEKLGL